MLRACRSLLRPGGRLGFFTITVAEGLSKQAHRRAVRAGPVAVAARRGNLSLLQQAGFTEVTETDVTEQYRAAARAWLDAAERHRDELLREDPEMFEKRQRDRSNMVAAVDDGLLRRSMLRAVRPTLRLSS